MGEHPVKSAPPSPSSSSMRQVVAASFIGTAIEWYDFFLYGTAAALVFSKLFFPNFSELAGTLAAFATFAAGFLARPLGGIVFGHFGDRIGRKSMLVVTLLVMGVATFLIGLLPTYATIGVAAPTLLVLMRLLQGFAVGGEWGGAVLMTVEHSPKARRGFYGSWPQSGAPCGLVLATGAFAAFSALPDEQFLAWGWRVPFLLSAVLVAVGLFVRLRLLETPDFAQVKEAREEARLPLVEAIKGHPKNVLLAFGACMAPFLNFYLLAVFVLTYATSNLGIEEGTALVVVAVASAIEVVAIPGYAALSDRLGRRAVFIGGAVAFGLFAYPFFLVTAGGSVAAFAAMTILGLSIIHPAMYGPLAALFAEMFSARVRYSAASLGYQIGGVLGGGFAPFILTSLLAAAGGKPWAIPPYMIGAALVTVAAVYFATEAGAGRRGAPEAAGVG
ncbi:MAG: MFS transporter [Streptosporangiales bacterium]|nr:MFS transporter [Streptosporangiales bacterium]